MTPTPNQPGASAKPEAKSAIQELAETARDAMEFLCRSDYPPSLERADRLSVVIEPALAEEKALREALLTTEAEIVTLMARLSGPYRDNMQRLLSKVREAMKGHP